MDGLISGHWAVMGELDRRHRVKLVVDEWGAWYREGSEVHPSHLFGQQSTMRDALLAALTLDTFHRHADKVAMANVAQLVNCLQSLFLAHEDRFLATPTFDVFEMYGAHVGGQSVRTVFSAPRIQYQRVDGTRFFLGAVRIGVCEGSDADDDARESARHRCADRGNRRARRPSPARARPCVLTAAGHPRAQHVRAASARPGAGTRHGASRATASSCSNSRQPRSHGSRSDCAKPPQRRLLPLADSAPSPIATRQGLLARTGVARRRRGLAPDRPGWSSCRTRPPASTRSRGRSLQPARPAPGRLAALAVA